MTFNPFKFEHVVVSNVTGISKVMDRSWVMGVNKKLQRKEIDTGETTKATPISDLGGHRWDVVIERDLGWTVVVRWTVAQRRRRERWEEIKQRTKKRILLVGTILNSKQTWKRHNTLQPFNWKGKHCFYSFIPSPPFIVYRRLI